MTAKLSVGSATSQYATAILCTGTAHCRWQKRRFAGGFVFPTTVGYNTQTLTAGKFNLVSLPFAGVAGGNSKITEAMSGSWFGGETSENGDQIQVWSAAEAKYTTYYYYTDDSHEWDGWYDDSGSFYFDDCEENADGLEPGWTAWYRSRGATSPTVTMSGAVAPENDISITIYGGGFSLIANPFPTALQPNTTTQVDWGAIHAGDTSENGDQIQLWDAMEARYTTFYYYADDSHEWDGWYDDSGSYYFEEVMPEGIPAGQPFWYRSRDAKGVNHTVKFYNPTK